MKSINYDILQTTQRNAARSSGARLRKHKQLPLPASFIWSASGATALRQLSVAASAVRDYSKQSTMTVEEATDGFTITLIRLPHLAKQIALTSTSEVTWPGGRPNSKLTQKSQLLTQPTLNQAS